MIGKFKYILLFLLIIFTGNHARAQFGFRIAGGISDILFLADGQTPYLGYENNSIEHGIPLPSFQAGIVLPYELTKRIDCIPGLSFSRQGLDYSSDRLYDNITYRLNLIYLKLPLLMKIKTNVQSGKSSGLYLGPYSALNLDATMVSEIRGVRTREKWDNVNKMDAGGIVGYTWDIGRKPGQLQIDIHCSYSLVNMMQVLPVSVNWYYGPEKEYVRNLTLMIGFEFLI